MSIDIRVKESMIHSREKPLLYSLPATGKVFKYVYTNICLLVQNTAIYITWRLSVCMHIYKGTK